MTDNDRTGPGAKPDYRNAWPENYYNGPPRAFEDLKDPLMTPEEAKLIGFSDESDLPKPPLKPLSLREYLSYQVDADFYDVVRVDQTECPKTGNLLIVFELRKVVSRG
jgi:hypothetical protein